MAINLIFAEPGTDATQDFTFYSATGGTVTSDSAVAYTGTRSIKCNTGAGSADASVTLNGQLADLGRAVNLRFRFETQPLVTDPFLFINSLGGTNVVLEIDLNTDGTLQVSPTGATSVKGTTVLSAGTWYRLTISYSITSTTVFTFHIFINGVSEITATAGTLTNTVSDQLVLLSAGVAANLVFRFDDLYIDNRTDHTDPGASYTGPDANKLRITGKRPFANGTTNGFTTQIGAGGSGYGTGHAPQVNEQPLSQTNGWAMVGAGAAVTEEYNIEGASVGDVVTPATIVGWIAWVFAKSLSSETGKLINPGGTSNISLTSTPTLFIDTSGTVGSVSYPPGSGSDIGIITSTALTTVSLYECGVIVVYNTPSGSLFRTPSLSGVGNGGPFFRDPLQAAPVRRRDRIYVPARLAA